MTVVCLAWWRHPVGSGPLVTLDNGSNTAECGSGPHIQIFISKFREKPFFLNTISKYIFICQTDNAFNYKILDKDTLTLHNFPVPTFSHFLYRLIWV